MWAQGFRSEVWTEDANSGVLSTWTAFSLGQAEIARESVVGGRGWGASPSQSRKGWLWEGVPERWVGHIWSTLATTTVGED